MTHSEQRQQGGIKRFSQPVMKFNPDRAVSAAVPLAPDKGGEWVRYSDHAREYDEATQELAVELAEARTEAAQWEGSFKGMVAVEKELKSRLEQAEQQRDELRAEVKGAADAMDDLADEPAAAHKARAAFRVSSHLLRAAVKSASVQPPSGESDA